jgi:hypothetical protein
MEQYHFLNAERLLSHVSCASDRFKLTIHYLDCLKHRGLASDCCELTIYYLDCPTSGTHHVEIPSQRDSITALLYHSAIVMVLDEKG